MNEIAASGGVAKGRYRIAADIGGTFTDVVVSDTWTGECQSAKSPTTPGNLSEGILNAFDQVVDNFSDVQFAVHGTTQGLNALLSRSGDRILLLTSKGARDSFFIMRGSRPREEMYNNKFQRPDRLVRRRDTFEIGGRLDYAGQELTPLSAEDLAHVAEVAKTNNIKSVAVCFLFSFKNPAHEIEARRILQKLVPGLSVSLSHEVAREWREAERTASTVADAYIGPLVKEYLGKIEARLQNRELTRPLYVMRSSGGVMSVEQAVRQPIQTLFSGPVGGTAGATELAGLNSRSNVICADVGGTSFDVSLVIDGNVQVTNQTQVAGMDLILPLVEIESIGAGGGSLAYVEAGALRVGPESATAEPGPACYGKGGSQPTVTDAQVFLQRFLPQTQVGGTLTIDINLAESALARVAGPLGITPEVLAEGILEIANLKMANAIRKLTIEKGIEPREFSIVAFGGAGAMHAAYLAEALEISDVIIPPHSGVFSAWGMLHSPMRQDIALPYNRYLCDVASEEITESFESQIAIASAHIHKEYGGTTDIDNQCFLDMRYDGQEYTVTVEIPLSHCTRDEIAEIFHEAYRQRYGHAHLDSPIEIVALRLAATAPLAEKVTVKTSPRRDRDPVFSEREVMFGGKWLTTPVFNESDLFSGDRFDGPLIVDTGLATVVVPPGWTLIIEDRGTMRLTREGGHPA